MLPSISAGTAAFRTYAHAVAAAAAEIPAHDSRLPSSRHDDLPARPQDADTRPRSPSDGLADDGSLEAGVRAAVAALVDTLRERIHSALTGIGQPAPVPETAARSAAAILADAIAGDGPGGGRHAAQLLHAVVERLRAGPAAGDTALLHVAAKGIDIVVDHGTGAVTVTVDALSLGPPRGTEAVAAHTHLLDITDGRTDGTDPVFRALSVVREAAEEARTAAHTDIRRRPADPHRRPATVAPDAFVGGLTGRLVLALAGTAADGAGTPIRDTARTVSRAIATAVNASATGRFTATDAAGAIARLVPGKGRPDDGEGRIALSADRLSLTVAPRDASVSVRIGKTVTLFAPVSLAPPRSGLPRLPGLEALPLPVLDIPAGMPTGIVLDEPKGVPFIPPEIADIPPADDAGRGGGRERDLEKTTGTATRMDAETVRLIETALARNATVLRSLSVSPDVSRMSLDFGADVAPVAPGAPGAPGPVSV